MVGCRTVTRQNFHLILVFSFWLNCWRNIRAIHVMALGFLVPDANHYTDCIGLFRHCASATYDECWSAVESIQIQKSRSRGYILLNRSMFRLSLARLNL
jgi:hypothetical protein